MDIEGYNKIRKTLEEAGLESKVDPKPREDENLPYVTVETPSDVVPARVLNALANASLMGDVGDPRNVTRSGGPRLKEISIVPGQITFRDTNILRR